MLHCKPLISNSKWVLRQPLENLLLEGDNSASRETIVPER